jgi:hypothetical protein
VFDFTVLIHQEMNTGNVINERTVRNLKTL